MKTAPSFDDIFAVMSAASIGEATRVDLPVDADTDLVPTKFALALNVLLDDLAHRAAELAAGEARYRALFADSPLPMWVFDARTLAFLEVNDAAQRQYGYTRDELLAMTVKDLRPPEDIGAFVDELSGPLPSVHASRARHRRKDGSAIHVELHRKSVIHGDKKAWFVVANDITERVLAEAARAKAESRFARLSETDIIGMIIRSVDGRVLEVNEALARMMGCTREELLSGAVPWSTLTPETWRVSDQEMIAEALRTGITSLHEKEYVRRDGTLVPALVGAALLDEEGERSFIAFILDLTERKRAEAAIQNLREQRAVDRKFQALLEAAPDAMVIVDKDGRIVLVNAQTERVFGYTRGELVGQRVELLIPTRCRAGHPAHRDAYLVDGKPRAMGTGLMLHGQRKDGTEFPIEVSLSPLETADGTLVSSAIRDITERVRTDEARLRLSAIVDSSEDAIIGKSLDGTITSWNQGAERLFGYRADEMIGRPIAQLIPAGREGEEREILDRLRRGEALQQLETVRRRKDGRDIDVSVTLSPVRSRSGEIVGASKVARDITDRKRAELALTVANQELESFSYSVAHDLRAPLRGMNGFAQILLDEYQDKLDAEGQDCLREIQGSAVRMAGLIDALLSLARVTRSQLKAEWTDLSAMMRLVTSQLAAQESDRHVEVVVEERLSAHIDPQLCRNLFDNLVGNAWKFTSHASQARIELGSVHREGTQTFFIRDNGAGFDMTYAKKLFTPFQRLHTVTEFPGTGIGLATARRIVHRHGGRIWAEGSVGAGATFYFTLPSTSIGGAT